MPGRHAIPLQLHLMSGNKSRLTKAEIEERKELEIRFGDQNFKPSSVIKKNKIAYKKWKEKINLIVSEIGIEFITTSHQEILERYCITYAEYINLQSVRAELLTKGYDKIKTYHISTKMKLEEQINKKVELLTKLEDRLLFTPLSNIKTIPVKKKKVDDEKDLPIKQMFGE